MHIEIWSDIACPFCYIGKRHLEAALDQTGLREKVTLTWKSFELDPDASPAREADLYTVLGRRYGQSREQAVQMTRPVQERGQAVGLDFHFEQVVPTNTFDAHRLLQLAQSEGLAGPAAERLFTAYFTEGKNIGDPAVLRQIGSEIGLAEPVVDELLASDQISQEVRADEAEARQLSIRGVPFFVFDRQYAISGAQPVEYFVRTLEELARQEV